MLHYTFLMSYLLLFQALRSVAMPKSPLERDVKTMVQSQLCFQSVAKLAREISRLRSDYAIAREQEQAQRKREIEMRKRMQDLMKPVKFNKKQFSVKKSATSA
eukprot:m.133635 g.133635  ORF g.133635 m.133635 type:complete len:103 (+) comp13102_c0_seq6:1176-1484(+)